MLVSERLRLLRESRMLSQTDVAILSNIAPSYICTLETTTVVPSLISISRLARVFGLSLSEFLQGVDLLPPERIADEVEVDPPPNSR